MYLRFYLSTYCWSGFSTIDHIQVISQLQEKADEYNIPLSAAADAQKMTWTPTGGITS